MTIRASREDHTGRFTQEAVQTRTEEIKKVFVRQMWEAIVQNRIKEQIFFTSS